MTCSPDQHNFPTGSFICIRCGAKDSALARGEALPYASWKLATGEVFAETPRSITLLAIDTAGRHYAVREYFPDSGRRGLDIRRQFVRSAKALRESPVSAMQTAFPYTKNGRFYTVSDPPSGTALSELIIARKADEIDALARLHGVLLAIHDLHTASDGAGMLFHGGLRLEDVRISGTAPGDRVELWQSLYIENFLTETPLTTEQAFENDLRSAGQIILRLMAGNVPLQQRQMARMATKDLVLDALLDVLLTARTGPMSSAKQLLEYMELLKSAKEKDDLKLYEAAYAMYHCERLQPIIARLKPATQQPAATSKPAAVPATAPPLVAPVQKPLVVPPTPPPSLPPQAPQPQRPMPPPAAFPQSTAQRPSVPPNPPPIRPVARRRPASSLRRFLVFVVFLVIIFVVLRACLSGPPATSLSLDISPNPITPGQQATISWSASGYEKVELNGRGVANSGFEMSSPQTASSFHLAATRSDGHIDTRDRTLNVFNIPQPPAPVVSQPTNEGAEAPAQSDNSAAGEMGTSATPSDQPPVSENPAPVVRDSVVPPSDAPVKVAQPPPSSPAPSAVPGNSAIAEVVSALNQFANAMVSNDPATQAACYAPHVERYFLQSDVTDAFVLDNLKERLAKGERITRYSILKPILDPQQDGTVQVKFTKEVTVATPKGPNQVTSRSVLHLAKIAGRWKVTYERDFKD